jgi:hypothetical protein
MLIYEVQAAPYRCGRRSMKGPSAQSSQAQAKQVVGDRAVRLLASSIYRQLQDEGYEARDIISVSSQLIDLVTHELGGDASTGE